MTSSTFAWAWDLEIPAEPKMLLTVITDAAGMGREYDVDHVAVSRKCGIPTDELHTVFQNLAARDLLEVLSPAETDDGVTTVYLNYPTQEWEVPQRPKCSAPRINHRAAQLYVISGGEAVTKIGVTTDTSVRIKALEKAAGRELKLVWTYSANVTQVRGFEKKLLRMFAASRIRGEWVSASADDVISAAIEVCGGDGVRW
jgi:hypothetical protein